MWPILLDMTKDECKRTLRRLELEAYGSVVSALRAQGGLTSEKHKLLQDVASTLNIPQERHRAEVRRACNDERLATIAHCMTGDDTHDEWALEGRRVVPLMPRIVPQTAYSVIADDEANKTSIDNEKLPLPVNTERKRPLPSSGSESGNKNVQFRVPSESITKATVQNTVEDIPMKKRKTNINMEGSSLAQHLMMPQPKISRVQQLYRQKTKALLKSQSKHHRIAPPHSSVHQPVQMQKQPNLIKQQQHHQHQHQQLQQQQQQQQQEEEIVNTLQEVPIPLPKPAQPEQPTRVVNPVTVTSTAVSNENHIPSPQPQPQPKTKPTVIHSATVKSVTAQGTSNISAITTMAETPPAQPAQKSIKICPARKIVTSLSSKSPAQPQKVIIVSSSQGSTTSSILQRTLTIPFVKTIAMKNLDKVKVINNPATTVTTSVPATVTNSKPKLLTVQTKAKVGSTGKTVSIPFIQGVQLQALQNKGAIKMFPVAKSSKSTMLNTNSSPVYIMNTNTTLPVVTKSASTPVLSTKAQNKQDGDRNVIIIKNEEIKAATSDESTNENVVYVNKPVQSNKNDSKSSVLAEILKASGVLPTEEQEHCDIESQISQLTQIPTALGTDIEQQIVTTPDTNSCMEEEVETTEETEMETIVQEDSQDEEHYQETVTTEEMDTSNYVILQENDDEAQTLMLEEQPHHSEEVVELMGSLDPETGMYSVKATQEYEIIQQDVDSSQSQTSTDSYLVDMESLHNSELDMPSLS